MMNYIWAGIILVSIFCGMATGRISQVSQAMFTGAQDAVTLVISLLGAMCLWSGIMRIADQGGVTNGLARLFSPLLKKLFPGLPKDSKAARAISMNLSANLLGMGNAATPLGIVAMQELAITFVVMNTASLQLIPSTIAVIRANYGCEAPFDIIPAIIVSSLCALTVGIIMAKLLERRKSLG